MWYNEIHALPPNSLQLQSGRERKGNFFLFNCTVYIQEPYPREQFKEFLHNLFSLLFLFLLFHRWLQHVSEFLHTYELHYFKITDLRRTGLTHWRVFQWIPETRLFQLHDHAFVPQGNLLNEFTERNPFCMCVCVRAARAVYFNINCTGRNLDEVFIKGEKSFEVQRRRFFLCKIKKEITAKKNYSEYVFGIFADFLWCTNKIIELIKDYF